MTDKKMTAEEFLIALRRLAELATQGDPATRPPRRPEFIDPFGPTGTHQDWFAFTETWRRWGHQHGVADLLRLAEGIGSG
jgi:hypothetical protein